MIQFFCFLIHIHYGGSKVAFEKYPYAQTWESSSWSLVAKNHSTQQSYVYFHGIELKCWGTGSLVLTETVKSEGWSVPSLFPQSETHSQPLWSLSLLITTVKKRRPLSTRISIRATYTACNSHPSYTIIYDTWHLSVWTWKRATLPLW